MLQERSPLRSASRPAIPAQEKDVYSIDRATGELASIDNGDLAVGSATLERSGETGSQEVELKFAEEATARHYEEGDLTYTAD